MPGSITGHRTPFLEIIVGDCCVRKSLAWEVRGMVLGSVLQNSPHSLGLSFLGYKIMELDYPLLKVLAAPALSGILSWTPE